MARTGMKTIFFPADDLPSSLDFIDKVKKKVTYVNLLISMKGDRIEMKVRGSRDAVTRALQEIREYYVDIVKS